MLIVLVWVTGVKKGCEETHKPPHPYADLSPTLARASLAASASAAIALCRWTGSRTSLLQRTQFIRNLSCLNCELEVLQTSKNYNICGFYFQQSLVTADTFWTTAMDHTDTDNITQYSHTDHHRDNTASYSHTDADNTTPYPQTDTDNITPYSHTDHNTDNIATYSHTDTKNATPYSHTDHHTYNITTYSHTNHHAYNITTYSYTDTDNTIKYRPLYR